MEILTSYWAENLITRQSDSAGKDHQTGKTRWIKPEKFKLKHQDLDRFHRSEWSQPGVFSTWYAVFRVVLALLMGVGVATHVYLKVNTPNPKWLIWMTNQVKIRAHNL